MMVLAKRQLPRTGMRVRDISNSPLIAGNLSMHDKRFLSWGWDTELRLDLNEVARSDGRLVEMAVFYNRPRSLSDTKGRCDTNGESRRDEVGAARIDGSVPSLRAVRAE